MPPPYWLQILDLSGNVSTIIKAYSQLSTLLTCPNLVEIALKGSCVYTDRAEHCHNVQRYVSSRGPCSLWLGTLRTDFACQVHHFLLRERRGLAR